MSCAGRTSVGTLHMFARCSIPSRGSRLLVVLNIATDRCIAVMVLGGAIFMDDRE